MVIPSVPLSALEPFGRSLGSIIQQILIRTLGGIVGYISSRLCQGYRARSDGSVMRSIAPKRPVYRKADVRAGG